MIAVDLLPWPWGEQIVAGVFAVAAMLRANRRRSALAWASQQPGRRAWPLAIALCGFLGRWAARLKLLGLRDPGDLRRRVVVEGEEHLTAGAPGVILLAFHIGPPNADLGLKVLGHRLNSVTWGQRDRPGWWSAAWDAMFEANPDLCPGGSTDRWLGVLYQARRILQRGGTIYIMADGNGREVARIPLPGGPAIVRAGWLNLHRHTGARVLPILTHLRGRTQVITIHPALPMTGPDPSGVEPPWLETLASLLRDHVRRYPEQCFGLAFRRQFAAGQPPGAVDALRTPETTPT
jgi:lauroyl/myristoyl acyltransferase